MTTNSNSWSNENSETYLSRPFEILTKVFYYMGLSAFSTTRFSNRYQKVFHLRWCFIHMMTISITYFFIFYYHREIFYIGDNFGQFGDFLKAITVGISHFITLIETIRSEESSAEFFCIYSALHRQWADFKLVKNEMKIYKKFFLLTLFYMAALLVVEINYMFEIHHKKQWISFFVAYMPSVTICRVRLLQTTMCLYLILIELLQLNKEMLELASLANGKSSKVTEEMVYKRLSVFMEKYQQLYTMMELLKKSHGVSFLAIFIKSYVKILSDSYWTYWVIYNQDDVYEFAEYSLVIPTALSVCLALIISKDCVSAAKLIPNSLHSLRHRLENLKLSYKIQNFSLQLLHQQIIFDAFGCFVVDCYIISGVLSSITTYMIFYIEFMPKFKNL